MMTSPHSDSRQPKILIVDDSPELLSFLTELLRDCKYDVHPAANGKQALQAARTSPPDLILLDIKMPSMSGFEVCARFKADEALRDIPVIFLSGMNETAEKVKAFSVGGEDYITKPFQIEEVQARVDVHMRLRQQKQQLQESFDRLRHLESLRDSLVHMVVHDMRSPLTAILGYLGLLTEMPDGSLNPDATNWISEASWNAERLAAMIGQLLDVSRLEAGRMPLEKAECDLVEVASEALKIAQSTLGNRRLTLKAPKPALAVCDRAVVGRVIGNLLSNAIKCTPREGRLRISVERVGGAVRCAVTDNGPGIAAAFHGKIFDKFCQIGKGGQRTGAGLGLAFCKLAIEAHGGRIGLKSQPGKGSVFWFELGASTD